VVWPAVRRDIAGQHPGCSQQPGCSLFRTNAVFRVLRSGGRLQMADILLHDDVTPEEVATKGSWSD